MQKEFIYLYKEKEYKVLVTYKRSRSISMRIKDGILNVNAPYLTSYKSISNVIDKYAYKLFEENSHNTGRGDNYIYILGIKIEITYPGYILFNDNQSIVYKDEADLDKKLKKWFLSLLVERTRYYENMMGLYENKIHLKNMVSRYGSNVYSKHSISYSTVLMHYTIDVIDAIVVHELAHCLVHDHSKNFYNVVYRYCPNYKILSKRLKKGEFHV